MNVKRFRPVKSRARGFSLLEVLVAAVVLATGLLALAALQAALSRNASDARARSQVAAFVDLAVERVRNAARGAGFSDVPPTATAWVDPWTAAELAAVEASAGVSNLDVAVTGTQYDGRGGAFVEYDPAVSGAITLSAPQYKEVHVTATWTDATGASRRYDLATIVSPRTTTDSSIPFAAPTGGTNDQIEPVVRTPSPVEDGVIPIAIGDNSDTAATNPRPIISGGNVIRTSYEVLTYRNEDDGSVRQQRRVETAVVACECSAGAAPTGAQFENAQWPAYWNGERYVLYAPTADVDPAGTAAGTGPSEGVTQDVLCTECCRDHHDGAGDQHVEFDPFRQDAHDHYRLDGGSLVEALPGEDYIEACRMIRVDGFWRTAQDLDAKHFGLLETDSFATSPIPDAAAQDAYEDFAIEFLKTNYMPEQTALAADAVYESFGLNAPADIDISRPEPKDERYLHARGLYVDNLEDEVEDKIAQAHANCTRANPEECILPFLAFTSINVTEAAFWEAEDSSKLTVDSDGFVVFRPNNPNRGRVNAIATAMPNTLTNVVSSIQPSNSGVAVRSRGVDPEDDVDALDTQAFQILGGVGTGESGAFTVALTGLPAANRSPGVGWAIGTSGGNCQGPSPYNCATSVDISSGGTATVTVASYNRFEDRTGTATITCPNSPNGSTDDSTHTYTANGQKRLKYCQNYQVSSVSTGGVIGTILREGSVGDPNTGTGSEATEITFPVSEGAALSIGFTFQAETLAPVATCTFKNNGSLETAVFANCP